MQNLSNFKLSSHCSEQNQCAGRTLTPLFLRIVFKPVIFPLSYKVDHHHADRMKYKNTMIQFTYRGAEQYTILGRGLTSIKSLTC